MNVTFEMLPAIEYITLEAGNIEFGQVVSSSNPNEGLKAICKKTLSKAGKRFYLLTLRGLTAAIVTEPYQFSVVSQLKSTFPI